MQDWEGVLRRGYESKDLDYKGPCAWAETDKKASCELVKDILAIANTKGGFIVIGVSETPTGFSWDGLTDAQCKSFETSRINRFIQNYADPPINAHVVKHASQGPNFVIIEIPRFHDTPHICQKDFPGVLATGTIYVRTDNNESAPIKDPSDMRAIVEQATRNRGDQLLASFRAILTGSPQMAPGPSDLQQFTTQAREAVARFGQLVPQEAVTLGFRETLIHPAKFDSHRFTIRNLEQMAEAACVSYRGWPYLFYSEKRADCITHLDDGLEMWLGDVCQFWRAYQSGCLYVNELFHEDRIPESRSQKVLGTNGFAYTCAEAVQCLVDLFTGRLPDDEPIRLQVRLRGVRGRTMAIPFGNVSFRMMPQQCEDDQIVYEQQLPLADWRAGVIPHALDLFQYVQKKFQAPFPPANEAAALMQNLLGRQM